MRISCHFVKMSSILGGFKQKPVCPHVFSFLGSSSVKQANTLYLYSEFLDEIHSSCFSTIQLTFQFKNHLNEGAVMISQPIAASSQAFPRW
jgi:enoyl-[acyl-carrier-protein] reductase (NADH)